ncbi:alpha/beta hydrolase [Leptolyngbya sp. AN03gr2]|uniref:alpha/beta hydrolase n=1 Tax=unclassified Leptolyngbya TaxID=2650499 RepID=UPI003D31B8C9
MISKKIHKNRRSIALSIGILLLAIGAVDRWLPYALISHYKKPVIEQPSILNQYDAKAESITFTTRDRINISGWFISAKPTTKRTIILLHTRGGTRQDTLEFGLPFLQSGFNLAMIDLRGHGKSGGEYFTFGYHEWQEVSALLDSLEARQDSSATDVTLIGISAGGAVAISAAAKDPRVKRVVSIAAFADLGETIRAQVPWLPGVWRNRAIQEAEQVAQFRVQDTSPINAIRNVRAPVLIVHGNDDRYIPLNNANQLFEAATTRKELYVIEEATHENMLQQGGQKLHQQIVKFINCDDWSHCNRGGARAQSTRSPAL